MRRRLVVAAVLAFLLPVGPARAVELLLSTEGQVQYDSNVFSDENQEIDDFVFRYYPEATLRDPDGRFRYDVTYRPSYEAFLDINGINNWSHVVRGDWSYALSPRTNLVGGGRYARPQSIQSLREAFGDVLPGEEAELEVGGVEDPTRAFTTSRGEDWEARVGLTRFLSPSLIAGVQVQMSESEPREGTGRVGSTRYSANSSLDWTISDWDRLLFTFQWSRTDLTSSTVRYLPQVIWTHQFNESWSLEVAAGPQLSRPDEPNKLLFLAEQPRFPTVPIAPERRAFFATENCPLVDGLPVLASSCAAAGIPVEEQFFEVFPGSGLFTPVDPPTRMNLLVEEVPGLEEAVVDQVTDLALVGFTRPGSAESSIEATGRIALIHRSEYWDLRMSYARSEGGSESLGNSVVTDIVSVRVFWRPAQRWRFIARGTWRRQTSEGDLFQPRLALAPRTFDVDDLGLDSTVLIGRNAFLVDTFEAAESIGLVFEKISRKVENTTYIAGLRGEYKLNRNTSLFATVNYRKRTQESRFGEQQEEGSFDAVRTGVGLIYRFNPIRL